MPGFGVVVDWLKYPGPVVVTVDTPPAPQVWVVVVPPKLLLLGTQELLLDPELPSNRSEKKLPIDSQKLAVSVFFATA
jgi:hypothetical protein